MGDRAMDPVPPSKTVQISVEMTAGRHSNTNSQDLQELERYLLRGIRMVESRAAECVEGTRIKILAEVATRTDSSDSANTIWIRGAPGSGKSSISLSTKSRLHSQGQLVTYFRFDRNEASITTPTALWRRVAYDLACRLPSIIPTLLQQLRDDTVDLDSPMSVFTSLVEEPLKNFTVDQPFVVVIDALDECGGLAGHTSSDRRILLQTLRQWSQLPKHFKMLVTSRHEGDISRALSFISAPIDILSGDFLSKNPHDEASIHATNDIRILLEDRFRRVRERIQSLPRDWPGAKNLNEMVRRAAGIFMWATAAANFIDGRGIDPQARLGRILRHIPESSGMAPLYSLYGVILETAFGDIDEEDFEAEALQFVLGTMVLARRPFNEAEYPKVLASKSVTGAMIDSVRDGLHSVLAPGASLRFTHKSFDDFLLSNECSLKYKIREEESQYLLANFCLTTMTARLRFNLCGLETSCLKNTDIPGIETKVSQGISGLLSYSCSFWAEHLSVVPVDERLMDKVREVFLDKLLYWFEVMSLLRKLNQVPHSLLTVLKWSHASPDNEFRDFVQDARRFIRAFASQPIAQSAPHIYISALPFAPQYSSVARHYLPQFPRTLALSTGKSSHWPSYLYTSNRGIVHCFAFSADEKLFVTGSAKGDICILDSESGNLISGPFTGVNHVSTVSFDRDARHVLASYARGQVIIWDIETGDKNLVFETGRHYIRCSFDDSQQQIITLSHEGEVTSWCAITGEQLGLHYSLTDTGNSDLSVIALSSDGHYIACANRNDTVIKIWMVMDGREFDGPYNSQPRAKHTKLICAVAFSAGANFAVSGSKDGTILIWDAKTGDTVGPVLNTGKAEVDEVAYSPTNNLVVASCDRTGTVEAWNVVTHEKVLGPLGGHESFIHGISLTRDGEKALTASPDGTVRMWDLSIRRKGVWPENHDHKGHTNRLRDARFSPCGRKVASLGRDTIRVWDTSSGELLKRVDTGSRYYNQIIFSPDGHLIVASGMANSMDRSIRAWNVDTGELVYHHNDNQAYLSPFTHTCFRSTDQRLITYFRNGIMRIWNLEDGVMTEELSALSPQPVDVTTPVEIDAISPDGMTAIVRDDKRDPRFYIWNTKIHQPITFVDEEYISGYLKEYSPSGRLLTVANTNQDGTTLRIWDTQTGNLIARSSKLRDDKIHCLAFSPNDHHLAFSYGGRAPHNRAIWIMEVKTGRITLGPRGGHSDMILTLAFSPDGEKLVSGSAEGQIRVSNMLNDSQLPVGFLGSGTVMEDGWVRDTDGNLQFWVPSDHRTRLLWPGTVTVMGSTGIKTKLDLSKFRYGENWAESFGGGK